MENFDFDNRLKEGLDNINPILDNNEIWDNIEPHLKKKKKRRFIIWFFIGALGALGLLLFQADDSQKENLISENKNKQQVSASFKTDDVKKQDLAIKKDKIDQNNSIRKNDTEHINKPTTSVDQNLTSARKKAPSKINKNNNHNQSFKKQANEKSAAYSDNQITKERQIISNTDEKIEVNSDEPKPKDQSSTSEQNIVVQTTDENKNIKAIPLSGDASIEKIKDQSQAIEPKAIEPQKAEENVSSNDSDIKQEASKKLTKKEREEAIKKRKEDRRKAKEERVKKKEANKRKNKLTEPNMLPKWKYNIQLMGSGIYTNHTFKEGDLTNSEYLRNRKAYVKNREGFGIDLNFVAESPSGFLLTVGAQFQQLHEKLNRQETVSNSKLEEVIETITENANGEIINTTSSMQLVTTTTTYNQQLHNKYRFFNIPVGVGYSFTFNKMRFKLLGGIDLNTFYKFSGSIFNRELDVIKLDSRASLVYNKIFEKNVGFGFWANVEWHKPINRQLSIVVASGVQTPLNSLTKNEETWPTSHKIFKIRLGVGINYMFGGIKKSKNRKRKG